MAEPAPALAPEPAPASAPELKAADPAPAPAAEPKAAEPKPTLLGEKKDEPKAEPVPFDAAKITLPEGFEKDEKVFGDFAKVATELKLPQESAQKLVDLYSGAVKAVGEANTKLWNDTKTEWESAVKADPEIGGDKLTPTVQQISRALDTTLGAEGAKSFKEAMEITGAGSHPAVVKALAKFATLLAEGGHVPGSPGKGKVDTASLFFPNSPEMKGTP